MNRWARKRVNIVCILLISNQQGGFQIISYFAFRQLSVASWHDTRVWFQDRNLSHRLSMRNERIEIGNCEREWQNFISDLWDSSASRFVFWQGGTSISEEDCSRHVAKKSKKDSDIFAMTFLSSGNAMSRDIWARGPDRNLLQFDEILHENQLSFQNYSQVATTLSVRQ